MFTSVAIFAATPDALATAIDAALNAVPGITMFSVTPVDTFTPGVLCVIVTYK